MVPSANLEPEAGIQTIPAIPEPSVAFGYIFTMDVAFTVLLGETVILEGQLIDGSALSATVTVNAQVAVLKALSVATQVVGVAPREKFDPEAGVQIVELMPERSDAVYAMVTGMAGYPYAVLTVTEVGQLSVGEAES